MAGCQFTDASKTTKLMMLNKPNARSRMWLLPILVLLLEATHAETRNHMNPVQFKAAAFNVRVGRNASPEEIGHALKPYDLDVVCFSEAPDGDWTERAGKVLGLNHVVLGRYPTAGHDDKYKTIVSRTPLYGAEEILMADSLHTVTRAITEIERRPIVSYSVHFPFGWRDQAHIDETTGKVTAFVDYLRDRPDEIAIIMGDFNFEPSRPGNPSKYHDMFIDIGLDVSWRDLGIDTANLHTSRLFKPESERTGHVIDHIVYPTARVKSIDGDIIEFDKPMSDHKPVWAHLEIR